MKMNMKDKASAAGHAASSAAKQASRSTRQGTRVATDTMNYTLHHYPLMAMGGALLAGFALGMMVPHTRREDEAFGSYRDQLMDQAWESGEDLVDRGRAAARATYGAVVEEVVEQGLTPKGMKNKAQHVAEHVRDEAQEAAEEEGLTGSGLKESAKKVAEAGKQAAKQEINKDKSSDA